MNEKKEVKENPLIRWSDQAWEDFCESMKEKDPALLEKYDQKKLVLAKMFFKSGWEWCAWGMTKDLKDDK